ncbi:MAG: DUF4834 family protein [Bacteroidales bacterium]|nr:DUF4834 family protein [Bacteroidales bacterium]
MSFFTIIFLILVFWWVIRPIWRVATAVNRARRQAQQMADAFSGQSRQGRQGARQTERKAGWSTPTPHKKHVAKDVGEYVAFEEVTTSETTQSTQSTASGTDTFQSETWERVTDAEWEEIK